MSKSRLWTDLITEDEVDQKLAAAKAELLRTVAEAAKESAERWQNSAMTGGDMLARFADSLSNPKPAAVELPNRIEFEKAAAGLLFRSGQEIDEDYRRAYHAVRDALLLIVEGKARVVLTDQENSTRG